MGSKDRLVILLALIASALALAGAAALTGPINDERSDLQLTGHDQVLKNAPPEVVATQMLGAFRGLFLDLLWIRIEQMKNDGQFQEAMQLSEWITKLQPRFPQVWVNRAWNLGYNISVATHTPQERWMWVQAGINLLRDEAIPANPDSVLLYKELSWHFLHKIGQFSDDMNWYYKIQLADHWHKLLGPPPSGGSVNEAMAAFEPIARAYEQYLNRTELSREIIDEIDRLIAADALLKAPLEAMRPQNFERFRVRLERLKPAVTATDSESARRLNKLEELVELQEKHNQIDGLDLLRFDEPEIDARIAEIGRMGYKLGPGLDEGFLIHIGEMLSRQQSADTAVIPLRELNEEGERLGTWLRLPSIAGSRDKLLAFLRARVLGEVYHMDPRWMLELMQGEWFVHRDQREELKQKNEIPRIPLDWRHFASHGLYWASMGVKRSEKLLRPGDFDILNTDRHVLHALQALRQTGRLIFDPVSYHYALLPDPQYTQAYHWAVYGAKDRIVTTRLLQSAAPETFLAGHENFLQEAVAMEYFHGSMSEAQRYYEILRTSYSGKDGRATRYTQPLDDYVLGQFIGEDQILSIENSTAAIFGLITQAIDVGWINGLPELSERRLKVAESLHARYTRKQGVEGLGTDRMEIPPFSKMFTDAFTQFLLRPDRQSIQKARAWRAAPVLLRQRVYDQTYPRLKVQAERDKLDPQSLFPIPDGMDEYRASVRAPNPGDRRLDKTSPFNPAAPPVPLKP